MTIFIRIIDTRYIAYQTEPMIKVITTYQNYLWWRNVFDRRKHFRRRWILDNKDR